MESFYPIGLTKTHRDVRQHMEKTPKSHLHSLIQRQDRSGDADFFSGRDGEILSRDHQIEVLPFG